jgi:hypothetical protein
VLIKASAEEASLDRRTFVTRSLDHATLDGAVGVTKRSSGNSARRIPPLVRAGATLQADWRTPSLHAEMPVVALDSGASGSLIRVRVGGSNRIMRGRIVTAHTVSIIAAGA